MGERERQQFRDAKGRERTRHNKKYGQAPARGRGFIKCEMCGKPLSRHKGFDACNGQT